MNVSTFVDSIVIAKSISQMMDLKNAFLKLDRPYKHLFLILVLSSLCLETKLILYFFDAKAKPKGNPTCPAPPIILIELLIILFILKIN